ncbi:MAG: hypothetical protein KC493_15980 [Bacteriovoracaceae bacterium]|nr:hypothetical protein [Bacteriovoracaceae bacterium]
MNSYRIEIQGIQNTPLFENKRRSLEMALEQKIDDLVIRKFYLIQSNNELSKETIEDIFCDPVMDLSIWSSEQDKSFSHSIQIGFRAGVTDNTAHSAVEAFNLTGVECLISSGDLYLLNTKTSIDNLSVMANEILGNPLIQTVDVMKIDGDFSNRFSNIHLPHVEMSGDGKVETFDLNYITEEDFKKLNQDRCLAMTWSEFTHMKNNFYSEKTLSDREMVGLTNEMTDVELEVIAQSWSEHCKHKIFSANISFNEGNESTKIQSLYKSYIKGATSKIEKDRKIDWLKSVFKDNAGIVRFDDNLDLCIKVETHNSPSALDPYGGALTGILGVNRDILGTGMGALPIANTDVFCFADPKWPLEGYEGKMPAGLQKPIRLLEGVHKGVEDGGNKSGIPTVNGAIFFNESYAGKPLVYCGTVGVMPQKLNDGKDAFEKYVNVGDKIYVVGGAVGADGIHGATMSSLELDENSPSTAVQIGDPLTQRRVTDFLMEARDRNLFSGLTDNGAGGISSSVGEMATITNGATIELSNCPLKYPGLLPYEIMISESQERMSIAVPPEKTKEFEELSKRFNVTSVCLGEFTNSGYLKVNYKSETVALLDLGFLHESLPPMELEATWNGPIQHESWLGQDLRSDLLDKTTSEEILKNLLSSPNIANKEKWVRQYDHEVKGSTHIKPFTGKSSNGVNDSGVVWLYPHGGTKDNAVSIGCGMTQRLSPYDPELMAKYSVDEAMRNVVANGGDPDTCCMLDNFCWPDPVKSDGNPDGDIKLGQLVKTCQGLYDITCAYGTPLVSGKDSMKNDFKGKNHDDEPLRISILPTLLVTAMAKTNINATVTSDFKNEGDSIYLLGSSDLSFAGSELESLYKLPETTSPAELNMTLNMQVFRQIHSLIKSGILKSCHDVSDGGALVAIAESCFGNDLGADLNFDSNSLLNLFGEGSGRFVVSVSASDKSDFEKLTTELPVLNVGTVKYQPQFRVCSNDQVLINSEILDLKESWMGTFSKKYFGGKR